MCYVTRDRASFMSATTFRDATVVVVETSRDVVRAIHGLHELLQKPSVVRLSLENLAGLAVAEYTRH